MISPRPRVSASRSLLLLALLAMATTGGAAAADDDPLAWPEPQRAFLQDGPGLLLSPAQRDDLAAMGEAERQAWIDRFLSGDPLPETPGNELAEGIERRRRLALGEMLSTRDARWRLLFLNGPPLERQVVECAIAFMPMEIWTYPAPRFAAGTEATQQLVVYSPARDQSWRLWLPLDAKRVLYTSEMGYWLEQWEKYNGQGFRAQRFDKQVCDLAEAVDDATGVRGLRDFKQDRPAREDYQRYLDPPDDLAGWARAAAATELPEAPPTLAVSKVETFFPEKQGQRIVTRTVLTLPGDAGFAVDELEDPPKIRLLAKGIVEQGEQTFDELRLRFQVEDTGVGIEPELPVVVISASEDPDDVTRALDSGAMGFIPKSQSSQVMINALRLVLAGGVYLPPEMVRHARARTGVSGTPPPSMPTTYRDIGLTERQAQVLALLIQGKPNKLICRDLDLAEGTVKIHITAILKALKVSNRTQAVIEVSRLGLKLPAAR